MRSRLLFALVWMTLSLPLQGREASSFIRGHRDAWYPVWEQYGVQPKIAESVVYPEILRYVHHAGAFDRMQTALVHGTYLATGGGGFDLSIGYFQMKPSFAEQIENESIKCGLAAQYGLRFDTIDHSDARDARMARLSDEKWQCIYLALFMKLLYRSFGSFDADGNRIREGLDALPAEEQVRLIAAAYNRGCRDFSAPGTGDLERLRLAARVKSFHLGLYRTVVKDLYRYSDVAADWYGQISQ